MTTCRPRLRISAPAHMALDTIHVFAFSKLPWIKGQQRKVQAQKLESPCDYIDRESCYLWGKRFLLTAYSTRWRTPDAVC